MNVGSENDKYYSLAEDAMDALGVATLPGSFLVDTFPIRMSFNQKTLPKRSLNFHSHSEIRPRVVPWSRLQDVREDSEGEAQ